MSTVPAAPRDPTHKALVDAIIDGEIDTEELAKRASELGKTLGLRLTAVAKGLAFRLLRASITKEAAEAVYRLAYVKLTLFGFQEIAAEVHHVAESSHREVKKAAAKVADVSKVAAVRRADKKSRQNERRGISGQAD